ncbi:hypothetical protein DFJ73DRAFT_285614 [Zopfochytrium polystomum]|nr:hypothetical protein DFJ73DRAFT_285614 [Zopfochytrium polystomum]
MERAHGKEDGSNARSPLFVIVGAFGVHDRDRDAHFAQAVQEGAPPQPAYAGKFGPKGSNSIVTAAISTNEPQDSLQRKIGQWCRRRCHYYNLSKRKLRHQQKRTLQRRILAFACLAEPPRIPPATRPRSRCVYPSATSCGPHRGPPDYLRPSHDNDGGCGRTAVVFDSWGGVMSDDVKRWKAVNVRQCMKAIVEPILLRARIRSGCSCGVGRSRWTCDTIDGESCKRNQEGEGHGLFNATK